MNNGKNNSGGRLGSGIDDEALGKINAIADSDNNGKASFGELFRMFRSNKLTRFESFYNALFITALTKTSECSRVRKEFQSLFIHPKGWFKQSEKIAAKSIWNTILGLLLFLPTAILSITAIPSRLAKRAVRAGEGMESSFAAGGFIKRILPTTLLIIMAFGVFTFTQSSAGRTTALELYVDDTAIGLVKSKEVYYSALDIAERNISGKLGLSYKIPDGTSEFKVIRTDKPVYLSDIDISTALEKSSQKYLSIGYGLYIDGTLVAVSESRMIMDNILNETLELYNTLYSATKKQDELISFANSVRINEITVPKTLIKSEEEIRRILGLDGLTTVSDLILKNDSVDTISALEVTNMLPQLEIISNEDISNELPEENLYYIESETTDSAVINDSTASVGADSSTGEGETTVLTFKTTETKTFTEIMPCEVKYVYDNEVLEGRKIISVPGVDGIKQATYEISYVGDTEIGRVLISEEILKEPTTKTVTIGTRPATDFDSETSITGTFIEPWPQDGIITSTFSGRTIFGAYEFHGAIDVAGRHGSTIIASDGGEVVYAGWNGTYGNCIIIDHGDGLESLYAHLSAYAVEKGDFVGQGWKIGEMGATGRVTGVHLHFEIRVNGVRQDPFDYLQQ